MSITVYNFKKLEFELILLLYFSVVKTVIPIIFTILIGTLSSMKVQM